MHSVRLSKPELLKEIIKHQELDIIIMKEEQVWNLSRTIVDLFSSVGLIAWGFATLCRDKWQCLLISLPYKQDSNGINGWWRFLKTACVWINRLASSCVMAGCNWESWQQNLVCCLGGRGIANLACNRSQLLESVSSCMLKRADSTFLSVLHCHVM